MRRNPSVPGRRDVVLRLARLLPLALLVGAQMASTALGDSSPTPLPADQQVLTVASVADVTTFDTAAVGDAPTALVATQIFDRLVIKDPQGNDKPDLATSWDVSPDGLTWTFHLRHGVTFQDGSPFDASVVKWHFDRILGGEGPVRYTKAFGIIIQSVDVVDPYTVAFVLKAPTASFLDLVVEQNGGMIMSKANFDALGEKQNALHPVGTGPFEFVSWTPGQSTVLKANPTYWGTKTRLQELIFKPIPESNTQVINLQTNGVQIIHDITAQDVAELQKDPKVTVATTPAYAVRNIYLNPNRGPTADLKVRQAINYALDTKTIVDALVGSMGVWSDYNNVMPLASWGFPGNDVIQGYPYNLEKAKQLLSEAGWTLKNGKLMKDGEQMKVEFISPNGRYFQDKEIAQVVKNQLGKLGIDVNLQIMEWSPFLKKARASDWDMVFIGWQQSTNNPSNFYDARIMTGGRGNYGKLSDPAIDALLHEADRIADRAKRKQIYAEVDQMVEDHAWMVPLYNGVKVAAYRTNVQGYTISPVQDHYAPLWLSAGN